MCARVLGDGTPVVSVRTYNYAQGPRETTVSVMRALLCQHCMYSRVHFARVIDCGYPIAQAIESCIQCTSFVFHMTTLHMQVDRWTSVRDPCRRERCMALVNGVHARMVVSYRQYFLFRSSHDRPCTCSQTLDVHTTPRVAGSAARPRSAGCMTFGRGLCTVQAVSPTVCVPLLVCVGCRAANGHTSCVVVLARHQS